MKHLMTLILGLFLVTGATAQVASVGNFNILSFEEGENFYFEGNERIVGAGAQFLGITVGANHTTQFGNSGLYLDGRITPNILEYKGVKLIAGVGGAMGYQMQSKQTDTRYSGVVGLRYKFVELTTGKVFNHDYQVPISLRLYLD